MDIAPATAADAPALARLCAAHAAYERLPHETDGHADRLARALASGRLQAWLIRPDHGPEAVGYASATLDYATLAGAPFVHLDCLYLAPQARGQGLGRRLVATVAAHARSLGCTQLQWQTPDWNTDAIGFYDRLGAGRLDKKRYSLAV